MCAGLALLVGLALLGAGPALAQDEIPQKIIAPTDHGEPTDVDSADVDGDGDLDLISASRFDDKIAWYENQVGESGTGEDGFGAQQVITTDANFARSVAVGDLDGDGDPDVLSASERDDKIAWYENEVGESGTGEDGFGAQQVITTDAEEAQSVAVGDLDGDGDPDVVSASRRDNKVAWYENQVGESGTGEDGFGAQQVITTDADDAKSVAVGDLDGDGDPDVISASAGLDNEIAWFENQVGESGADEDGFGTEQVITTDLDRVQAVTVGDLDGDGDPDVLSASREDNLSRMKVAWYENQIGESGNDSDGFGDQQVIIIDSPDLESVAVGDLDGDGDLDVLSASEDDDKVAWYENQIGESEADSDGFGEQQVIDANAEAAESVAVGDIDEDGDPDVLSASQGDHEIAWYENEVGESGTDEDGFGEQRVITNSAYGARSVAVGDIDGDGDLDVLSASLDDEIAWYENQVGESGAGEDGFGAQQVITTNALDAQSVAVEDLDGDGDLDVLSASEDDDKIAWYENQVGESGTGEDSFGAQQVITTSAGGARSVAVGDIDGDGDLDVLSASRFDDKIAWHENQVGESGADADGFGAQQVITTFPNEPRSVSVGDVDGDGDLDVLSASERDNKVAWHENQVGESGADEDGFGDQQVITTEAGEAQSVAVGDVDGDEDLDVLSASNGDVTSYSRIAWYENTDGVLPVELAGFGATVDDGAVQLSWQTASETNNAGFRIQRKRAREREDESAWTTVGSVEGSGTTSQAQSYRFTDADLPYESDALTYRLKQVDTDGTAHLSKTVTVERGVQELELLGTYPNPAQSQATVRYALPDKQEATIRLYDVLGRRVRTVVNDTQEGRHQRTLDVGALPSGVYFLRLRAGGQTRTQKLTITR